MSQKSPLARVNEVFGSKDKLVDKIVGLVELGDESKDELRSRLLGAANSKLIRLHKTASAIKEKFGSHDDLVKATATQLGRGKDKDYVEKLTTFSSGKLLDLFQSASRRSGVSARKAATASASGEKKPAAAKKAKPAAEKKAKPAAEKKAKPAAKAKKK